MKKILLVLSLLALNLAGCGPRECANCARVLFVGGEALSANNLPGMFSNLAAAGGRAVQVKLLAPKGWGLSEHTLSAEFHNALQQSRWDYVVLQEKDELAASEQARINLTHPAARALAEAIRHAGAQPVFLQNWARRDGMSALGLPTFEAMQAEIDFGYAGIAEETEIAVAPAGDAWFAALTQNPDLQLWKEDGAQPSPQGTYLAACVLYAVIFQQSPEGLPYYGGFSAELAAQLQSAAQTVLP